MKGVYRVRISEIIQLTAGDYLVEIGADNRIRFFALRAGITATERVETSPATAVVERIDPPEGE